MAVPSQAGPVRSAIAANVGRPYIYATDYYVASDRDLKRNIADIDGQAALDAICAIGGKRYEKQTPDGAWRWELGAIAQDVIERFPEQVGRGDDGQLHVGALHGPIFAAIARLAQRLDAAGL